jgi:hypothetical protein
MATAKDGKLFVANTSNVKEMKNGRPMNVKIAEEGLPNCTIVTLGAAGQGVEDHVFPGTKVALDKVKVGDFVVVAPEIMVEEARKTDGHIGKYRLDKDGVHTGYELHLHDRLELSEAYFESVPEVGAVIGNFKVISVRTIATGMIIKPEADKLYTGAQMQMVKIELVK